MFIFLQGCTLAPGLSLALAPDRVSRRASAIPEGRRGVARVRLDPGTAELSWRVGWGDILDAPKSRGPRISCFKKHQTPLKLVWDS